MGPMRRLIDAVAVLVTIFLVAFASFGIFRAAQELGGGDSGWADLAAIVGAALMLFLTLVSSALAGLVLRRRGWLLGYLVVTVLGLAWVASGLLGASPSSRELAEVLGYAAAGLLAVWLPVATRWWLRTLGPEAEHTPEPVSSRAATIAGIGCAVVVLLAVGIVLAVAGSSIPPGLLPFALVLLVTAAASSGRAPESIALVLLLGVALCALLFDLTNLPQGRLVIGALALAVLVAFSWRPLAVRLTAARAATQAIPGVPEELVSSERSALRGDEGEDPAPASEVELASSAEGAPHADEDATPAS